MYVQWASCDSSSLNVTRGVRQGGRQTKVILIYMDALSDQLNNSNIYTIILLKYVAVGKLQVTILARPAQEMSQTVRTD